MPQNNHDISGDLSEFATKLSHVMRCSVSMTGTWTARTTAWMDCCWAWCFSDWESWAYPFHDPEQCLLILEKPDMYIYINMYDIQWNVVFFWVKLILNDGKPFGAWAHKAHNTYPQTVRRFLQGHLGQNAMEIIRGTMWHTTIVNWFQ